MWETAGVCRDKQGEEGWRDQADIILGQVTGEAPALGTGKRFQWRVGKKGSLGEDAGSSPPDPEVLPWTPVQEDSEARSPPARGRVKCNRSATRCSEQGVEAVAVRARLTGFASHLYPSLAGDLVSLCCIIYKMRIKHL